MTQPALKHILEAAMMAAGTPLSVERIKTLFDEDNAPSSTAIYDAIVELRKDLLGRGVEVSAHLQTKPRSNFADFYTTA
jgi:segregation and condensation protein B